MTCLILWIPVPFCVPDELEDPDAEPPAWGDDDPVQPLSARTAAAATSPAARMLPRLRRIPGPWSRFLAETLGEPERRLGSSGRVGQQGPSTSVPVVGKRLVVIGGDAAGGSAASQAKKRRPDLDVVM